VVVIDNKNGDENKDQAEGASKYCKKYKKNCIKGYILLNYKGYFLLLNVYRKI
jgi:hypothetical protein